MASTPLSRFRPSLLALSAASRLGGALLASLLLWLAVAWAMQP